MTDFFSEPVVKVKPLSMIGIEAVASGVRQELGLDTSAGHSKWGQVVDRVLPNWGIHVYPAAFEELGANGFEAATDPVGSGEITILLLEELYDALRYPGRRGNRGRATIAHELGHAVLHVPYLRKRRQLFGVSALLPRVSRGSVRAYEDPEWQAWAFAGALLVPRTSILSMRSSAVEAIADAHGVSLSFLLSHLKRLKLMTKGGERLF